MEIIVRAAVIYLLILVLLRVSGKRTLSQLTTMDLILLLIISEATQQAILGDDFSIVGGALAILTLITLDRISDTVSYRSHRAARLLSGGAVIVVEDGRPIDERMHRFRLTADDVLEQARASQGLERMDQIKYAVLERTGSISVIPRQD